MLNHHHSYKKPKTLGPVARKKACPTKLQALQKEMLLLLVVMDKGDNPPELAIKPGIKVGALVIAASWQNRAYAAIYGELVFVKNNKGHLEVIQTGEICTVNKKRPLACVAHVRNKVLIPLSLNAKAKCEGIDTKA